MWNNNSRRWLVNREDNLMDDHSVGVRLRPNLYFYSKKKCRTLQRPKATRQINTRAITITTPVSSEQMKGAPFQHRVKPCPNQIIVVMLNVLLANCLISNVAKMPTAGAAFGTNEHVDDERNMFDVHGQGVQGQVNYQRSLHHHHHHQHQHPHHSNSLLDLNDYQHNFGDQRSVAAAAAAANQQQRSQNFKISPKPCSIGRIEGTCMFVWECIKSEGRHVGMCVDSFMFGSCCSHNISDNIVLSQTFSYTRPTKPVGISSLNHKPRPPQFPQRPSISGMTTIERPHGAGTLVIRPSGPHHQGALFRPQAQGTKTKPTSSTTHTPITKHPSPAVSVDMQSSASIPSTNMWHTSPQTITVHHHWQLSTEPNFITRPRPPTWEKPTTAVRPKPPKPTKKPINYDHPAQQQPPLPAVIYHQSTGKPTMSTTTKPTKPQIYTTKPMSPVTTTTTRPHFRPTAGWSGESSLTSSPHSSTTADSSSTTLSISSTLGTSTQQHFPTTSIGTSSVQPQHQHQHYEPITRPPSPAAITSSVTAISTVGAQHHTTTNSNLNHQLNSNNQEANEIIETDPKLATIKTITAARSECGIPVLARPETRIVGGKSAPFGRWPWQVSVRRTSFFGFSSTHRCGGALINENWIATAGHCVDDLLISQIRIRVGEYDFSHVQEQLPYIERGVAKKVVHPKYNFFTYEYDLALVKLEQPLEFAPHVSPICLPQTDSLLIGMNATVTGWGRLSEGGTLPSVLQEVTVPIVSNDNCKTMFLRAGRQEFIPDIFLCAGYETGGQDSCQGDSGGPLQVKSQDGRFFLAGIISWGIGCAEANLPGVCTRISKFVPWILETVT